MSQSAASRSATTRGPAATSNTSVIVVNENQFPARNTNQCGDVRTGSVDVDSCRWSRTSFRSVLVVIPIASGAPGLTRTRRAPLCCTANRVNLPSASTSKSAAACSGRGLQPLPAPIRQVAPGRLLQSREQVSRCVVVRVGTEVVTQPARKCSTRRSHQLLQHGSAFA